MNLANTSTTKDGYLQHKHMLHLIFSVANAKRCRVSIGSAIAFTFLQANEYHANIRL